MKKSDLTKMIVFAVGVIASVWYILAADNWLPFGGKFSVQLIPDILFPIIFTVCAALLLFVCNGMTTKKCLIITAVLDLLIGAEYAYDFLCGLETGIFGLEDPAALTALVAGLHVLFAAAVWGVSFPLWRAMEKRGWGTSFNIGMNVTIH